MSLLKKLFGETAEEKKVRKEKREKKITEKRLKRANGGRKGSPKHIRQVNEKNKHLDD